MKTTRDRVSAKIESVRENRLPQNSPPHFYPAPYGLTSNNPPYTGLDCVVSLISWVLCNSLQLTKFTNMNVWAQFLYWSEDYPTGPNDRVCRSPWKEAEEPEEEPPANPPPAQGGK